MALQGFKGPEPLWRRQSDLFLGPWLCLAAMVTKPDARASAWLRESKVDRPGHLQQRSCQRGHSGAALPSLRARLPRLTRRERTSGLAGLGRPSFSKEKKRKKKFCFFFQNSHYPAAPVRRPWADGGRARGVCAEALGRPVLRAVGKEAKAARDAHAGEGEWQGPLGRVLGGTSLLLRPFA